MKVDLNKLLKKLPEEREVKDQADMGYNFCLDIVKRTIKELSKKGE